ncbi:MAG: NAD(P)-dependent oxidoreductase [Gemmatimonadaceae bacterium]
MHGSHARDCQSCQHEGNVRLEARVTGGTWHQAPGALVSGMTTVAFLGLGAIGAPMARHLAGPYDLVVWNRTRARADEFARATTVRIADSPAGAARGAGVVITCLPASPDVASLLDGDDGLLAGLAPGSVLIDCTSGDPATSRAIAARLQERGVAFLDAPVSGGVKGAEKGVLTVMAGGERAVFERMLPVLGTFGEKIVHCGPVGAGHALKSVNQALLAVHIWSAAEGLAVLVKAGVSPSLALDVINASSGRSNTSQNLIPERVLTRAFPRTFRLALLDKDVGIAAQVAREHNVPAPIMQLTAELFRTAHGILGEEADHVEAVRVVEEWAKTTIADRPGAA